MGDTKVCVTPGASPGACPSESLCLQDAKDTVKWAESDSKVACITPYRWDDFDKGWSKVQDYWKSYGKKGLAMQNTTTELSSSADTDCSKATCQDACNCSLDQCAEE